MKNNIEHDHRLADFSLKRFEALKDWRESWAGEWDMMAEYVLPRYSQNKKTKAFDSTPTLAAVKCVSVLEAILTPRTQKWHSLTTGDSAFDQSSKGKRWLDEVCDKLFKYRMRPEANFSDQMAEAYMSLTIYGTAIIFIDVELGQGPVYKCCPLPEFYIAESNTGSVDTVFRSYMLTARQAGMEFGVEALPPDIVKDYEDPRHMDKKHNFVHAVFPRRDYNPTHNPNEPGPRNMKYASVHIAVIDKKLVKESGYRVMPYAVSRYQTAPGEVYGRGPTHLAFSSITRLNAIQKTLLKAAEKAVDPPLLLADDDVLAPFNMRPGALNYGALDINGVAKVVPMASPGQLNVGVEMAEAERQTISGAYHVDLLQILVESPGMTATEVMARAQEKAQLLGPVMGRQQSELLAPIISREIDILKHETPAFAEEPAAETEPDAEIVTLTPRYETPMAKALAGHDTQAFMSFLQAFEPLMQLDPAMAVFINAEEAAKMLATASGIPGRILRTKEEVQEIEEAQAQQQAAMQEQQAAMQALKTLPDAANKLMQAEGQAQGLLKEEV